MSIKLSTVNALKAKGLDATSPEQDIKKAYFATAGHPLSKAKLPELLAALNGDNAAVEDDTAATTEAPAAKAKTPRAAKPKAEKPAAEPKPVRVAETAEAALVRLKAEKPERFGRVQEILEMGKKGPTRVRIVCDDKGPNGETLTRDIKIQDLFQVRFSAGYKKPRTRKAAPAAAVEATPAASE